MNESEVEEKFKGLLRKLEREPTNYEKFVKFTKFYAEEIPKRKGGKYSERFFKWLIDGMTDQEIKRGKEFTKVSINLGTGKIDKEFDLHVEDTQKFIEVKKNIDMIERDLFKVFLLKNDSNHWNKEVFLVVWEEYDHIKPTSQYGTFLEHFESKEYIKGYSYLYPHKTKEDWEEKRYNTEEKFDKELDKLEKFLSS
ncbi:hypothetical protein AKJ45_01725 [candidate division MSBL1 archaeon SCGC-AAA261F19]|uniref:Restriction endonuclease n=2 Tax=candidate division MSBL1 TaxID=215777 RepID=A0A133VAC2_9EURY|nr:hypothetical protein AKJ43_03340 [candidate division MSBL1 archaeon SCGC-AAA261D19]KXB03393.1 hypothetical protein AKJ45_01725 [candidate division MSBL1 archaeon SCGC-AAA261F19]